MKKWRHKKSEEERGSKEISETCHPNTEFWEATPHRSRQPGKPVGTQMHLVKTFSFHTCRWSTTSSVLPRFKRFSLGALLGLATVSVRVSLCLDGSSLYRRLASLLMSRLPRSEFFCLANAALAFCSSGVSSPAKTIQV